MLIVLRQWHLSSPAESQENNLKTQTDYNIELTFVLLNANIVNEQQLMEVVWHWPKLFVELKKAIVKMVW